ncbi:MAG: DmsC/YnfH family molybdoenzyme membrane anchor subunit [Alphaproteobacteria bacterium]
MHPALSVILFTTTSGAGYGLLALLGLGRMTADWGPGLAGLLLAAALSLAGLVASTFHLGHPERAWRALSQWRTSWLSREGVMALVTFAPMIAYAVVWLFAPAPTPVWLGLVAAACAALTVACTGMIYASLRPVRHWHNGYVPVLYLLFAWASGSLFYLMLAGFFALDEGWARWNAIAALLLAWAVKVAYWRAMDRGRSVSDPGTATGLGHLGAVRQIEPPHTEENYVMREMGFAVARRHARRLRVLAVAIGGAVPLALVVVAVAVGDPVATGILAGGAALIALPGILIERWLFFAEARHSVTLYYGAERA